MGKAKKTRKYAEVKRLISPKDLKQLRSWCEKYTSGGVASASPPRAGSAPDACVLLFRSRPLTLPPAHTPRTHMHRATAKKQKAPAKKEDEVRHVYVILCLLMFAQPPALPALPT